MISHTNKEETCWSLAMYSPFKILLHRWAGSGGGSGCWYVWRRGVGVCVGGKAGIGLCASGKEGIWLHASGKAWFIMAVDHQIVGCGAP